MAKATRVRYSGVAAFADDIQLDRIQALGSSSSLSTEDMKELGNTDVVEVIDDVPSVDVSVDARDYGSNQTLSLFTDTSYGCKVNPIGTDTAAATNQIEILDGSIVMSNGHRLPFTGTPAYTLPSGGNFAVYAKYDVSASPQYVVQASGTAAPSNAMLLAYVANPSNTVTGVFDQRPLSMKQSVLDDFELSKVDMYVPVKETGNNPSMAVKRTMYMENVFCNNYSLSYAVGGTAEETFSLETDNKRWFLNGATNIRCDRYLSSGAQTTLVLTATPVQLANGLYTLRLIKNGTVLTEGTGKDYTVSGSTVTLLGSAQGIAGDMYLVRYVSATATGTGAQLFAPVSATRKKGGLKQGQIEIYITDVNSVQSQLLRCQSVRISIPLRRDALYELGHLRAYDRPLQTPVEFTVSVEIKDSDLQFFATLAGKDVNTVKEINITDFIKTMGLTVKLFKYSDEYRTRIQNLLPNSIHPALQPLRQIDIINMAATSENWDVRVDSDATQTFDFKAQKITFTA